VAGLTRRRSLQVTQREAALLPHIPGLKAKHPCWGSRRLWAYVHVVERLAVHKQRVRRVMRAHHR
jgi:hypothetical protein